MKASFYTIAYFILWLFGPFTVVDAQTIPPPSPTPINILNTTVRVNVYEKKRPDGRRNPITFLSLHHNAQVGLNVVKKAVAANGGKLVEVVSKTSTGEPRRLVHFTGRFQDENTELCFDPNRIFSDDGIKKTLEKITNRDESGCQNQQFRASSSDKEKKFVVLAVTNFRIALLKLLKPNLGGILVAVHNNSS